MICDVCGKREAVLFVQQLSFNEKKEIHLCAQCAKERGIDATAAKIGLTLENLVNSLAQTKKVCYACGQGIDDIMKKGQAGCPECYAAFQDEIRTALAKRGYDFPYTGSMPQKLAHFRSVLTDRIAIQNKLEASLKREDYEKAAMYRDFLKALEYPAVASAEDNTGDS